MIKLYFKKLLLMLCLFLMWFAVSAIIATVCGLANDLGINYTAYTLCMVASGVLSAVAVGVIKTRDSLKKVEYITAALVQRHNFRREIVDILKSKPFIAELLAFATWLVPLMVYVCRFPENAVRPIGVLIATSVFVIVVFTAVFALLDLIVSFIVRKIWMRGY